MILNFKFQILSLLFAILAGFFWLSSAPAEASQNLLFGSSEITALTKSDDSNYDYMEKTKDFQIYFKQNPITKKVNIKYQRDDSWIEFNTLSSVKIADKKKTVNFIASADDSKYCKYLLGLCDLAGYFKLWGTAAISFGNQTENGGIDKSNPVKFTYSKVWQEKQTGAFIDADYTVSPNTFLEEFVLNKYQDIDSVTQNVTLHNAYLKQEGENINFYSSASSEQANQILFFIPKPKMYEQAKSEIRNPKSENFGLHFELEKIDDSRYILTKIID